jgi:hypothetical protein
LRVSSQQEEFDGLDLGSHGEKSYNLWSKTVIIF